MSHTLEEAAPGSGGLIAAAVVGASAGDSLASQLVRRAVDQLTWPGQEARAYHAALALLWRLLMKDPAAHELRTLTDSLLAHHPAGLRLLLPFLLFNLTGVSNLAAFPYHGTFRITLDLYVYLHRYCSHPPPVAGPVPSLLFPGLCLAVRCALYLPRCRHEKELCHMVSCVLRVADKASPTRRSSR